MLSHRPHEHKPDRRKFYVYDLNYKLIGEVIGLKNVKDIIGTEINDYQISNNSQKRKIDKKYYVTKESFFTANLFI